MIGHRAWPECCHDHRYSMRLEEDPCSPERDAAPPAAQPDYTLADAIKASMKMEPRAAQPEGQAPSKWCTEGDHDWCFNRDASEANCRCSCHHAEPPAQAQEGIGEETLAEAERWSRDVRCGASEAMVIRDYRRLRAEVERQKAERLQHAGESVNASRIDGLWRHERQRADRAEAEAALLKTAGIIEVAVRNPNVSGYTDHWEGRALKAEAAEKVLREGIAENSEEQPKSWQAAWRRLLTRADEAKAAGGGGE